MHSGTEERCRWRKSTFLGTEMRIREKMAACLFCLMEVLYFFIAPQFSNNHQRRKHRLPVSCCHHGSASDFNKLKYYDEKDDGNEWKETAWSSVGGQLHRINVGREKRLALKDVLS